MDLRQLRYFLAVVDAGSFSGAAAMVNVAQPALSLHVKKMEEALGVPLLLRGAQGVTATEAGALLAARARRLLVDFEQSLEDVRTLGQEPAGSVRIGLPGTISSILSVPLIHETRVRFPGIKLVIAEAMSGFVQDWLRNAQVDLGVIYLDPREAGLIAEPLLDEDLVLVLRPGEALAGADMVELLARLPLIVPSGAHGLRQLVDRHLTGLGLRGEPAIEVDSFTSIKTLVAGGHGCSILPYYAVAQEVREGKLAILRFVQPPLWRTAYLIRPAAKPMSRATEAVADTLRRVVRDMIADGSWAGARLHGRAA
ncbi:MAG: LysR family transcriptional regulator [Rhodobacteraceae bacterium]|nr:LysR family transcriptional regulator [Paracoccaceae bacterium]